MSLRSTDPVPLKERQAAANCSFPIARSPLPVRTQPGTGIRIWWSQTGSNRRPDACKAPALPTELWPHIKGCPAEAGRYLPRLEGMVGLDRLELSTLRLSGVRSNHLSYRPPKPSRLRGARSVQLTRPWARDRITNLLTPIRDPPVGDEWKEKRRRRRSAPILVSYRRPNRS